ncbi:hypothetical protein KAI87_03195, partial [Myxococcota bacterium]|nr:hypothetical protein [Myxococcota bacterium]
TTNCDELTVSFSYQRVAVEVSDDTYLLYNANGTIRTLHTFFGGSDTEFQQFSMSYQTDSYFNMRTSNFYLLFETSNCDTGADWFYLDDITIECTSTLSNDSDGDGVSNDNDCAPLEPLHWNDCDTCVDWDRDHRGVGCNLPSDCDDTNYNTWDTCGTCIDTDVDGYYTGCNDYFLIGDVEDCDDGDEYNWVSCTTCVDTDGDLRYSGCDSYPTGVVEDCKPSDAMHWDDCDTCEDVDGDGYTGTGCNENEDCDDSVGTGAAIHPGAYDDIDGTDQDCNGSDGLAFDDFESGTLAGSSVWESFSGAFVSSTYASSGTYSLDLDGVDSAETFMQDTSMCTSISWEFQGQRSPGEVPDSGDDIYLQYFDGNNWVTFHTWLGGASDADFALISGSITDAAAFHSGFYFRFLASCNNASDDFYVDDFAMVCEH